MVCHDRAYCHELAGWVNLRQPVVYQIWSGLNQLLEPIYAPIRRFLPNTGAFDLAPLIGLIGVYAIQVILRNNMMAFY